MMPLTSRSGNLEVITLSPLEDVGVGGDALPSLDLEAAISGLLGLLATCRRGAGRCDSSWVGGGGKDRGMVDGSTFEVATSRRFVIATMASVDRQETLRAMRNSVAIAKHVLILLMQQLARDGVSADDRGSEDFGKSDV